MIHFKNIALTLLMVSYFTACGQVSNNQKEKIKIANNTIMKNKMKVEIWSDVMCPFCYIGKRKFETALAQFPHKDEVELIWKSYQLSPEMKTDPNTTIYHF